MCRMAMICIVMRTLCADMLLQRVVVGKLQTLGYRHEPWAGCSRDKAVAEEKTEYTDALVDEASPVAR